MTTPADLLPSVTPDTPPAVLRVRLAMARAYVALLIEGYNALRSYQVDYQSLPSYKNTSLLDDAARLGLEAGFASYITWTQRVSKDIKAAIRRKGFHVAT